MNCSEAQARLLNGDEDARWHALHCAACAKLIPEPMPSLTATIVDAPDAEGLWQGMPEALAQESRWFHHARGLSTRFRYALAALGLVVSLLTVALAAPRPDLAVLDPLFFWLPWTLAACITVVSGWACLRPVQERALNPGLHHRLCLVAVLVCGLGVVIPEVQHTPPGALRGVGSDLLPRAMGCFVWGSGVTAVGLAAAFAMLRGQRALIALPSSLWAVGVLLGQLTLALHCPLASRPHLALGHASIGVATVAALAIARVCVHWRQGGGLSSSPMKRHRSR